MSPSITITYQLLDLLAHSIRQLEPPTRLVFAQHVISGIQSKLHEQACKLSVGEILVLQAEDLGKSAKEGALQRRSIRISCLFGDGQFSVCVNLPGLVPLAVPAAAQLGHEFPWLVDTCSESTTTQQQQQEESQNCRCRRGWVRRKRMVAAAAGSCGGGGETLYLLFELQSGLLTFVWHILRRKPW